MTNTNATSGAADKALAYLDALSDDAAAHIFPSDLAKCMASECVVEVCSVRAGNPNEKTVPLFSREQVVAALASAAAPAEQPDTAYAALPVECDSPELCAVSQSCAGQFGTKRICASRGQAPAGAASVTDAMVLAALQVQYPAGYGTQLRHPANGPKTSARTEAEIDLARRMIAAALATHSAPAAQAPSVLEDAALSQAARDVLAERQRQISTEGWTPEHDDEHVNYEIAAMACYYVMPPGAREWSGPDGYGATLGEAIRPEGWDAKDCDRRRELVKGAALALAELERIDRAAMAAKKGEAT